MPTFDRVMHKSCCVVALAIGVYFVCDILSRLI